MYCNISRRTHIFNLNINFLKYPQALKISRVIPILKKNKDPNDPLSYRYVNLMSVFSKIFEKIMIKQINKYMEEHQIIPSQHMGGISGLSTIDALSELNARLRKCYDITYTDQFNWQDWERFCGRNSLNSALKGNNNLFPLWHHFLKSCG